MEVVHERPVNCEGCYFDSNETESYDKFLSTGVTLWYYLTCIRERHGLTRWTEALAGKEWEQRDHWRLLESSREEKMMACKRTIEVYLIRDHVWYVVLVDLLHKVKQARRDGSQIFILATRKTEFTFNEMERVHWNMKVRTWVPSGPVKFEIYIWILSGYFESKLDT